jgi:hypothetical protein
MPPFPLCTRLIGLALVSAAALPSGLVGTAAVRAQAMPAAPTGQAGAAPQQQLSSAQAEARARADAERILKTLQSARGLALYRLFSPNLQQMTSPALVQQRLSGMPTVKSWSIGAVEPGLDSNTVTAQLQTAAGSRRLLLVIDAAGLLEGYHLDASDQPAEAVARKFVEGLGKGRYVSARSLLSPNLQEEIPATKLQLKWQRLQRLTGDYVAIKQVLKAESTVDSKLVLVTTQFSRLTDSLFVILDSNNQIVGVDFPTEANGPAGGR